VRRRRRHSQWRRTRPRLHAYVQKYPEGRERAKDPDIVLVRVLLDWGASATTAPNSFGIDELVLGD
jgi:hypothetical protein